MSKTTNISELAGFFPDNAVSDKSALMKGRVKPLRGETQKQCDARRSATAERIERKLQQSQAIKDIQAS